jgi:hypothetical protein
MTGVEEADLRRDVQGLASAFADMIEELVREAPPKGLLNEGHELRRVFVVPNGHLNARSGPGLDWTKALTVLRALPPELEERGFEVELNSYGYEKLIRLAINAHKRGYLLRVL